MPNTQQDKDFASQMEAHISAELSVSTSAIDTAINWIGHNLEPDDVFDVKDLQAWAESNGYTKE